MNKMEIINSLNKIEFPVLLKYVNLSKLIDLLISGSFYFTRLDHFEDKSEAISQRQLAKSFEHNIKFTRSFINELSLESRQRLYFASCWFGAKRESVGMWNLYSDSNSVALRFKIKDFNFLWQNNFIKVKPSREKIDKIYINKIEYKDYFDINDALSFKDENKILGFHKDKSFEHEKEVRVLIKMFSQKRIGNSRIEIENNNVEYYKIKNTKIKTIPFEIIFHPKMSFWQKENIKKLIKKYGYSKIECMDSELMKLLNPINN